MDYGGGYDMGGGYGGGMGGYEAWEEEEEIWRVGGGYGGGMGGGGGYGGMKGGCLRSSMEKSSIKEMISSKTIAVRKSLV
ncbi:hypothetical protein TNCT_504901 [Trichonephila clavata]|uniref:Uncharacterized protein n=1 Tax=Trichonephila clavata TaxID=2740835 RepID=A0A8X6GLU1_TRICU|nr:hypothetical protein TNCT_504901 [Trichonephila clavata]